MQTEFETLFICHIPQFTNINGKLIHFYILEMVFILSILKALRDEFPLHPFQYGMFENNRLACHGRII